MTKQTIFNISICVAFVAMFIFKNETVTPSNPINYDLYKYKFQELETKYNDLQNQSIKQDTILNQIKYKIISDEKTIRNASNTDIDSIFNAMVARQFKGRL